MIAFGMVRIVAVIARADKKRDNMERTKYCCEGQHAGIYTHLWPMNRNGIKYYTAVYCCEKCHSYTLRGETSQKQDHTTFVEFISEKKAIEFKSQKRSKNNGMEK